MPLFREWQIGTHQNAKLIWFLSISFALSPLSSSHYFPLSILKIVSSLEQGPIYSYLLCKVQCTLCHAQWWYTIMTTTTTKQKANPYTDIRISVDNTFSSKLTPAQSSSITNQECYVNLTVPKMKGIFGDMALSSCLILSNSIGRSWSGLSPQAKVFHITLHLRTFH